MRNRGFFDDRNAGIINAICLFLSLYLSICPSFGITQRNTLRSDTRRELAVGGLDTVYRTVSTVVRSCDLFLTPSDQWPLLFRAIYTRRTVCCKRSTATSTARRRGRRSAPFVGVTCLLLAGRNVATQVRDTATHALACARGKLRFFFSRTNDYDAPPTRRNDGIVHLTEIHETVNR